MIKRNPPFALIIFTVLLCSCSVRTEVRFGDEGKPSTAEPQNLFVFLDGTANDPKSGTNVWRLYNMIANNRSRNTKSIYIEGVGTRKRAIGSVLGVGMEKRILLGYNFLATHYRNRNDRIYIFGFSRGAHQARALAGMISYVGLPYYSFATYQSEKNLVGSKIIDFTMKKSDSDVDWSQWSRDNDEPILQYKYENYEMRSAGIEFLGVWDTVPGSLFKEFSSCKEVVDDNTKGTRYKSASYPPIKKIVHAMSADEKRSKFRPIRVCKAISEKTTVNERWFPGAHSDVGGGYGDPDGLPAISFRWMLSHLEDHYPFVMAPTPYPLKPLAIAHWSIGDRPGNIRSKCENRMIPPGAEIDDSLKNIKDQSVPIRMDGKTVYLSYPLDCGNINADNIMANSGYYLKSGTTYQVRLTVVTDLQDKGKAATFSGWTEKSKSESKLYPIISRFTRYNNAELFSLIGVVDGRKFDLGNLWANRMDKSKNEFMLELDKLEGFEEGDAEGTLYLFLNDNINFYGNNSGEYKIKISCVERCDI